jgi:hypothetical protein
MLLHHSVIPEVIPHQECHINRGRSFFFFHSHTVHIDIKVFYLPTNAQKSCFKKNIKIYIKTALTCFGAITNIREHTV